MKPSTLFAAAFVLIGGGDSIVRAQDESWIGQLVICKKSTDTVILRDQTNGKDVAFAHSGSAVSQVRGDNGLQLRIHDGHRAGWVDKSDFILVRDAPMFFQRRVLANPKDSFALYMRGVAFFHSGEPEHAIVDFTKCLKINPNDEKSYNFRGNAWRQTREFDKAINDYAESIRLNPKVVYSYFNRGITRSAKRDFDSAIKDFDEAIRIDPQRARILLFRGAANHAKRDFAEAMKDYDECLRLDRREGVAAILGSLAAKQTRDQVAAKRYLYGPPSEFGEGWPFPMLQYLRGDIDEPMLLGLANDNNRLTEVCTILGLDHLLSGRTDEAAAQLLWVRDFGTVDYAQYPVAVAEAERLKDLNKK